MQRVTKELGLGSLALAGTAFFWSLAGLFIKLVDWNPFAIAASRSVVAALFLWATVRRPRFTFSLPQIGAAVASALTMLMFVYANKHTSSANAILLQYGAPIYTAILASLLVKERPRAEHLVGFAAIAAGMALFFVDEIGGGSLVGDLVAVGSGVSFAFYFVFMRMQKEGSPQESNILAHIITALTAGTVALFLPPPVVTGGAIAAILGLGVLQIGMASVLFAWGIKRVPAMEGILIAGLEPIFNPLWVFLALGERPGRNALIGGAIILAAVLGSSVVSARRDAAAAKDAARGAARAGSAAASPTP